MAKIKTEKFKRHGSNNYDLSRTSCGVVISPDENTIWIKDTPLDYDSLSPLFKKECAALLKFAGHDQTISRLALVSNRPSAMSGRSTFYNETTTSTIIASGLHESNLSYHRNLDKTNRSLKGRLYSFNDSAGNPHNIIFFTMQSGANTGRCYAIFFEGDDISNPTNVICKDFGAKSNAITYGYYPVHIDPVNKIIYTVGIYEYHHSTGGDEYMGTTMGIHTFTTTPVDGTLSLSSRTGISSSIASFKMRLGLAQSTFWCGLNNASESCFLTIVENESSPNNGATQPVPNTASKTSKGRYIFWKYIPASSTTTIIADLKGIEGFVGNSSLSTDIVDDYFAIHSPSHWEPSPISGETNIYYAYTCGFNASTGNMSVLRLKWDKSSDTFAVNACTLTLDSGDDIKDFITYRQIQTNHWNPYFRLNSVLTKKSNNYYLSIFYTHGTDGCLNYNSTQTLRNLTSFSINSANFTALTYHSSTGFPALDYVTLNSDNTKLASIELGNAKTWNWDNTNGFTADATEPGAFLGVTRDPSGRIWGVSTSASDLATLPDDPNVQSGMATAYKPCDISLHLLNSDVPNTVSVEFQDSTITYTGTNLSKNLLVNAYDTSNTRIAKNVELKITAGNAVFTSNSSKTLTVTTSTSADTVTPLTISGAGFINISASFSI